MVLGVIVVLGVFLKAVLEVVALEGTGIGSAGLDDVAAFPDIVSAADFATMSALDLEYAAVLAIIGELCFLRALQNFHEAIFSIPLVGLQDCSVGAALKAQIAIQIILEGLL